MTSDPAFGDLLACARSLPEQGQTEAVVERALECALAALREDIGLALVRTTRGAFRIVACKGLTPEDETAARAWCERGSPVVSAIEDGRYHLLTAGDHTLAWAEGFHVPRADVRFLAVVPFLAPEKSIGGMVLLLRQEPDKPLWEKGLAYLGASTGLAIAQTRFKEMIATQNRLASLGRVAAGVAHELKSPFTVLGTTLELLREDLTLSEDARKKLARARDAFDRAATLIDEVSRFSKPTRVAERIWLSDLFSALQDLVGAEARSRSITLEIGTSSHSLAVQADWGRLLQVLINLVENALEAIGHDGRIALEADRAGDRVRISVRDSGPGIAADLLDRIFDPFVTTKANGTGLGLAIVREIVEQLGGAISVDSKPGAGAEFSVTFPSS